MTIEFKKLVPEASMFLQNSYGDAGYDITSLEDGWLRPGERKLFKSGVAIKIPYGFYGRIAPRSGLALKQGIDVLGGVIDASYRGDVGIILLNTNSGGEENSVKIEKGQRIAQIIFEKCYDASMVEVQEFIVPTGREDNGFGSSDALKHGGNIV